MNKSSIKLRRTNSQTKPIEHVGQGAKNAKTCRMSSKSLVTLFLFVLSAMEFPFKGKIHNQIVNVFASEFFFFSFKSDFILKNLLILITQ